MTDAELYRLVSRLWDGPRNAETSLGILSSVVSHPYGEQAMSRTALRLDLVGYYDRRHLMRIGGARGYRATVAALLAAMIETGDDPLTWEAP